jgi:hypothetical protein
VRDDVALSLDTKPQTTSQQQQHTGPRHNNHATTTTTTTILHLGLYATTAMDAFGNRPRALRLCPKCPRSEGAMGRISDDGNSSIGDYPWMETAECGQCSTKWYIAEQNHN